MMAGVRASCAVVVSILLATPLHSSGAANAASAPTDCRIWFYGFTVSCTVEPDVDVAMVVRDRAEAIHAAGSARSDRTSGAVTVPLMSLSGDDAAILRPEDEVEITIAGAIVARVDLPAYRSDLAADGHRIVGVTSPGAALVFGRGRPGSDSAPVQSIDVSVDGAFALALDPPLGPDDFGYIRIENDGMLTASAYVVPTAMQLSLMPPRLSGSASPGSVILLNGRSTGRPLARSVVVAHGGSGAPGAFTMPLPALDAGSPLDLSARMPGSDGRAHALAAVPRLWVALDRAQRIVYGAGPPQQSLRLSAGPLDRSLGDDRLVDEVVETADDGAFELDVSDRTGSIEPGWGARVSYAVEPGLEVTASHVLQYLRTEVHGSTIDGVVETESPVTVTLHSASGALKARQITGSDERGAFRARLLGQGLTRAAPIRPSDRIVVDVGSLADPVVLTVPSLAAWTDIDAGVLRGVAQPAARLVVLDAGQTRQVAEGQVGLDGAFAVAVPGMVPGASGVVRVHDSAGHQLVLRWAALTLELDQRASVGELTGNGLPGRRVEVSVTTVEGALLAKRAAALGAGNMAPTWRLPLLDMMGQGARVVPGDRIDVQMGDEQRSFVVPPFELVPDRAMNAISGTMLPGTTITLGVQRAPLSMRQRLSNPIEVEADAQGRFSASLPDSFALGHNDAVLAVARPYEGISLVQQATVHGLTVDLTAAQLRVAAEPGAYRITIGRGGRAVALRDSLVTADAKSHLEAVLRAADGALVALMAGDVVTVERVDAPGGLLETTVPDLRLEVQWSERRVQGAAPVEHEAWLVASPSGFRGADVARSQGELRPERDDQGSFNAAFDGFGTGTGLPNGLDNLPGVLLELRSEAPDGTRFLRSARAPLANMAVGGAWVCVLGSPNAATSLELLGDQGIVRAHASGATDARGRWSAGWIGTSGALVIAQPGDRVTGTVGMEAISMTLPHLDAAPDWHAGIPAGRALPGSRIAGTMVPRAEYFVAQDDAVGDPCFAGIEPPEFATRGRADAAGAFEILLDHVGVGEAVEVAQYDANGHRAFRRVRRVRARFRLGTPQVELAGSPAITTALSWHRAGQPPTVTTTTLDGFGYSTVELLSAHDADAVLQSGDRLVLFTEHGEEIADLVPLDADTRGDGSLAGVAPPGTELEIALSLRDGRVPRLVLTADDGGQFSLDSSDLPARRDWQLDDASVVEIGLTLAEGHEQVLRIDRSGTPTRGEGRVWLPLLFVPTGARGH